MVFSFPYIRELVWPDRRGAHAVICCGETIIHDPEPLPAYSPRELYKYAGWSMAIVKIDKMSVFW